jgi:hypothetical protein
MFSFSGPGFTLFFVVPSTSGKVVSYQVRFSIDRCIEHDIDEDFQLPDKVKLFRGLKEALDQLYEGSLDTPKMTQVRIGLPQ